jgi:hypothetical protein
VCVTTTKALEALTLRLAKRRSPDRLWAYSGDQVSAEPTCFALLALSSSLDRTTIADDVRRLANYQLRGGFWPAGDSRGPVSLWATAVAVNTLIELSPDDACVRSGLKAMLDAKPQEAHWLWRLKFRTTDTHVRFDPGKYGWGWVPGSVSWVIPTAMAVIALERSRPLSLVPSNELERRVDLGHAMLLDRMCPGGGWNAGNSVVYGVPLTPHIDATSLAIAALRFHYHLPEVRQSLSCLLGAQCSSAYSLAWKILALRSYAGVCAHVGLALEEVRGQLVALVQEPAQIADNSTLALSILALDEKSNPFAVERPA